MTARNAAIHHKFGPEDLAPVLVRAGVTATVLVQTRRCTEETEEFLVIAQRTSTVAGVVGWVELASPSVAEALARLREGQGGEWLVGIRHQVHDEDDPLWLSRSDVIDGIRALGEAGLVYDLLVRPRELPAALGTAQRLPEVRFVVDHLAKPDIAGGDSAHWDAGLRRLAALPNVYCKLSGLVTEADWKTWTAADLRPYIQRALEWFGPARCLFGSDWPVCLLAASYDDVVHALEYGLTGLGPDEREQVWAETAIGLYNLEVPDRSPPAVGQR